MYQEAPAVAVESTTSLLVWYQAVVRILELRSIDVPYVAY